MDAAGQHGMEALGQSLPNRHSLRDDRVAHVVSENLQRDIVTVDKMFTSAKIEQAYMYR